MPQLANQCRHDCGQHYLYMTNLCNQGYSVVVCPPEFFQSKAQLSLTKLPLKCSP